MASNRHLGRIVALQTIYEFDFRRECGDAKADVVQICDRNIERYRETIEDKDFIRNMVNGVISVQDDMDDIIRPIAPEWPIEQIARIDRSILRMALWELLHSPASPPKVVINEAVELAKAFGGDNSSKFINGVLGTAYRQQQGEAKPETKKKTKTTAKTAEDTKSTDDKDTAK